MRVVRSKYVNTAAMTKREWLYWRAGLLLLSTTVIYVVGWGTLTEVHAAKCDSIYYTLLRVNYEKAVPAVSFIREFFETANCDDIFNMSIYRRDYASKINMGDETRIQRIIDFKSNEIDEAITAQAVLHYHSWHERRLLKSVSWSSSFSYNILVLFGLSASATYQPQVPVCGEGCHKRPFVARPPS